MNLFQQKRKAQNNRGEKGTEHTRACGICKHHSKQAVNCSHPQSCTQSAGILMRMSANLKDP